jgi:hypothetical protein
VRRSARNVASVAVAVVATALLVVALSATAAFADTGNIIEGPPNGRPEASTNGWQAGICNSNLPACESTTPNQYATQAASHPAIGYTQFIVKHTDGPLGTEFPIRWRPNSARWRPSKPAAARPPARSAKAASAFRWRAW